MEVREVMTRDVTVLPPQATVREAAERMRERDIGPVPVSDGARLLGILTDRDIVVRVVALGKDPATTPVSEVMTPGVDHCFEDDRLEDALRRMRDRQIRRLVVLDRQQKLVGIVSLGDLSQKAPEWLAGEALENISTPGGLPSH
jgi:CBS domain-containing protein